MMSYMENKVKRIVYNDIEGKNYYFFDHYIAEMILFYLIKEK